jgi:hypothetical protein
MDSVYVAWDEGRYPDALERLARLLSGPAGDDWLEPAALLTGELYHTAELTADGSAVRWSPDGRIATYERDVAGSHTTLLVAVDGAAPREVATLTGSGLVFAPDGGRVAYVDAMGAVVVREVSSGVEERLAAGDLVALALSLTDDGSVLLAGGPQGSLPRGRFGDGVTQIYRLEAGRDPQPLTEGPGVKSIAALMGGARVLFTVGRDSFGMLDLSTRATRMFDGAQPAATPDGSAVAYVGREGEGYTLVLLRPTAAAAEPVVLVQSASPLAAPAISADGRRIAYQGMPREDWELYVVEADGTGGLRLTREIQHDLMPQLLPDGRILAVMGEGRHRRSYLYDLSAERPGDHGGDGTGTGPSAAEASPGTPPSASAGSRSLASTRTPPFNASPSAIATRSFTGTALRTRLFHNNTVRTVAPEYEWALSPDGNRLLIVAERDGDTVSPERGVYLVDLDRRVTKDEVLDRITANLRSETGLRERGRITFEPIRTAVADAVAGVSTARIYGYEHALFQFDSKYITQPGNAKAIEYIAARLREWGYEPELQWFDARGNRTANVIARLPGTVDPELIYVVSSHFDSVERGPGADDDTSGTAALLEAARVLRERPQPATIHFAFFTGEEAGLLGSREYVRRAVENGERIVGALNNDMIGFANDQRLDNTIRYSNDGIRDIQHAAAFLFTGLITYDAKYYKSTDAHAYYEAYGDIVGGIGSYPILGNPHYHQPHDVLETINHQLVAEVSKTTIGTLMLLASSPARLQDVVASRNGSTTMVTWTPAAERAVQRYVVAWGPPSSPLEHRLTVTEARAAIDGLAAGSVVAVKAVNEHGLQSWDWARVVVRQ